VGATPTDAADWSSAVPVGGKREQHNFQKRLDQSDGKIGSALGIFFGFSPARRPRAQASPALTTASALLTSLGRRRFSWPIDLHLLCILKKIISQFKSKLS
jgi:hypothetical protein